MLTQPPVLYLETHTRKETYTSGVRGIPPFAKCAKGGARLVLLMPTRSAAAAVDQVKSRDHADRD